MRKPTVLVVDDDENILSAFSDFLKKERCEMIAASSMDEAMGMLERRRVDVLIADVRLKAQSGVKLTLEVKRRHPGISIILITGYPELVSECDAKSSGADYFFLKPLNVDKLREAVSRCIAHRNVEHKMTV